jgi:hypothetical protein
MGRTSFHQRKPTSKRPVTFLTVQKSKASSSVTMTKENTNDDEIRDEKRYLQTVTCCQCSCICGYHGIFCGSAMSNVEASSSTLLEITTRYMLDRGIRYIVGVKGDRAIVFSDAE